MHDLMIGLSLSTAVDASPVEFARNAERLGFDLVSASDHPTGDHPTYETVALLTWIAAHTSTISVGTRVAAVPFRRPALLAKTAETLQRLSGGRFVCGLGGGYSTEEIVALGGASLSDGEKVTGMAEAIDIMRAVWSQDDVTYEGLLHSAKSLTMSPKPDAAIPIWLGTYGPRALAVTGRLADGWIPSYGFLPPDQVPAAWDRIRQSAADAGRGPDAVRAIYNVSVDVGAAGRRDEANVTGTPADVAEQLAELTALGFTGFSLQLPADQLDVVGAEVLPALRAAVAVR